MTQVLKRALPFFLAFLFGVAVTAIIGRISPVPQKGFFNGGRHRCRKSQSVDEIRRIAIESVPEVDFPEAVKKSGQVYASIRLIGEFGASGSVKSVRPYPMVPFGISESAAGVGEFADVTPFMLEGKFVDSLPDGLTELAIQQVSRIDYKPKMLNGQPDSQRVFVLTHYSYSRSRSGVGCGSIDVTILDDNGVLWRGDTVSRNNVCFGMA